MPSRFITAPISVWGAPSTGLGEQLLLECFNNSGGSLQHGDVVVIDNSAGQMPAAPGAITGAVTTTTTAKSNLVMGPVSIGDSNTSAVVFAANATCFVCVSGAARVQVGAQAAAAGSALSTTTTVKQALGTALPLAVADISTVFGIALEAAAAKDANNTIRALIKSA